MLPLLFILGFAVLGTVAVVAAFKQQRQARARLAALASRLGLELKTQPAKFGFEPLPVVEGPHRGRPVRFFTYSTGSGKNRTTWSAVSAAAAGAGPFTLDLYPQNFLGRVAIALGMQDIRVGDEAFDQAFVVKSNDPAYAAAALLPELREHLLAVRQRGAHGHLTVQGGLVRYAEIGAFENDARVDRLAAMLDVACDLAEVTEVYRKP